MIPILFNTSFDISISDELSQNEEHQSLLIGNANALFPEFNFQDKEQEVFLQISLANLIENAWHADIKDFDLYKMVSEEHQTLFFVIRQTSYAYSLRRTEDRSQLGQRLETLWNKHHDPLLCLDKYFELQRDIGIFSRQTQDLFWHASLNDLLKQGYLTFTSIPSDFSPILDRFTSIYEQKMLQQQTLISVKNTSMPRL